MKFYDSVKPQSARKVVSRWKLDPDYLYAIKQVEAPAKAGPTRVAAVK